MMKIKVTEKHIKNGTRKSINSCPIALALKSQGYKWAFVDADCIEAGKEKKTKTETITEVEYYRSTAKVVNFIERFDAGKIVKPTEFTVRDLYED